MIQNTCASRQSHLPTDDPVPIHWALQAFSPIIAEGRAVVTALPQRGSRLSDSTDSNGAAFNYKDVYQNNSSYIKKTPCHSADQKRRLPLTDNVHPICAAQEQKAEQICKEHDGESEKQKQDCVIITSFGSGKDNPLSNNLGSRIELRFRRPRRS